jgi:hypothetical protein
MRGFALILMRCGLSMRMVRGGGIVGRVGMGMAGVGFVQDALMKVKSVLTMRRCRSRQSRTRGKNGHERAHQPPAKRQLHETMRPPKLRRVKNPAPQDCQFVNAGRSQSRLRNVFLTDAH